MDKWLEIFPGFSDDQIKKLKGMEEIQTNFIKELEDIFHIKLLDDPNFKDTPFRLSKSWILEKLRGINSKDEAHNILKTRFPTRYPGMIFDGPTRCYGICPHHFENIHYQIWFGYIPNGKVIGLSKMVRLIELLAARPVLQEDLTMDIVELFEEAVEPDGCGVIVRGQHECMLSRGVRTNHDHRTITTDVRGQFRDNGDVKAEFLGYLHLCPANN